MTMDVQKLGRAEQCELKAPAPGDDHQAKMSSEYQTRSSSSAKRSFDVAFLMMPDERMKQKQLEKQLRLSKQIFDSGYHHHHQLARDELKGTDLSTGYSDKYRQNNNLSPQQELNIDVGTDEFATKSVLSDSDVSDMSRSRPNSAESFSRPVRVIHESPYRHKVFDDPSLMPQARPASYQDHEKFIGARFSEVSSRSAFTKVSNNYQTTQAPAPSPGHSESPDNLSYQNSMSPPLATASPPMLNNLFSKSPPFKSLIPPNHPFLAGPHAFFKSQTYHNQLQESHNHHHHQQQHHHHHQQAHHHGQSGPDSFPSKSSPINYPEGKADGDKLPFPTGHGGPAGKFGHLLPFRPEMSPYLQTGTSPYAFPNFHPSGAAEFLKFPQQNEATINPLIRNPAAAILSTLLPPTLATLSLPSQNVCAKCNISFRMTSDLVYHMRSHHKSEVNYDAARRKREDKLKCPVCAESFRERHHLTRHMTAHQDKEGDILDHQLDPSEGPNSAYCSKSKGRSYYGHSNGLHQK